MKIEKPKNLVDVQRARGGAFAALPSRVNLSYRKVRVIPLTASVQLAALFAACWILVGGSASAPTTPTLAADVGTQDRGALEAQLKELESQINQYESQVAGYKKQGKTLGEEVSRLNAKIAKISLQIKAINLTLAQLDTKIKDTQAQIVVTEERIDTNKKTLGTLVRNLYQNDRVSLVEMFLKNPKLSDFFSDTEQLSLLQNNVRITIIQIADARDQLQEQKVQFAVARSDAAAARDYQAAQKQEADQVKQEKNSLLQVTKGQESKYQDLLKKTKQTATEIRSRIFELLGGGELSFDQAYQYAKLAGSATGVRPALILAVLDRESALGKNVGRCAYTTAMSPKNQQIFLSILAELNLNPSTMTVSCPNADGIYGGAMGPAQFVPATWLLYRDAVAKITGRTPASPWNNADAFVATALYLRDAGAAGATTIAQERKAAARYYAGGSWSRFLWTYGEAVVSRAQQFQEDIATITG